MTTGQSERALDTPDGLLDVLMSDEDYAFRSRLRAWLDEHLPVLDVTSAPSSPGGTPEEDEVLRRWQATLHAGGWVGVGWPVEYGGRGGSLVQEVIFEREMARAGAPPILNAVGVNLVGPSLIAFGTAAQRARFLPSILDATEVWCQGFSEPNAGSDLASLTTRAVRTSSGWRITGTKIWTSFAHLSRRCCLIARTGEGPRKHDGLTVFLADMEQPEIHVSPISAMDGRLKLNEVFFDGAVASEDEVLGEINAGWSAVVRMLAQERVNVARLAFGLPGQYRELVHAVGTAATEAAPGPVPRKHLEPLVDFEIRVRAALLTYFRHLERQAFDGNNRLPLGSADKLTSTELSKEMHEHAIHVQAATGRLWHPSPADEREHSEYLTSFSKTLFGGTSEIQRNIVAERVLGLAPDAKASGLHTREDRARS